MTECRKNAGYTCNNPASCREKGCSVDRDYNGVSDMNEIWSGKRQWRKGPAKPVESPPSEPKGNDGPGFFGWVVIIGIGLAVLGSRDGKQHRETSTSAPSPEAQQASQESASPVPAPPERTIEPPAPSVPQEPMLAPPIQASPSGGSSDTTGATYSPGPVVAIPNVPPAKSSQARAPQINLSACTSNLEYPPRAARADATGVTKLRLFVSSTGQVTEAEVLRSAGSSGEHRLLDRAAISAIVGNCSGAAALDEQGTPAASHFEADIAWKLD